MLKLLRNFALAGLLLAGIMKLLAWWSGSHEVARLAAGLAPYAQLKYEGVSAGLDGSVTLDKVAVDAGHRVYRADSVVLESPGLFWLLGHALIGGNSLPDQFGIEAQGLKLPPLPWLDPQWLDPVTFVPFANVGCGSGFSDPDYQRMGVAAAPPHQRLDYRYDAGQHTLNLMLSLKAPGFAKIAVEADLKKYDAEALTSTGMWNKVQVDQVAADYTDLDFLAKRNAFCAQRVASPNPAQFVERHIGAVQELLKTKRIEPSSELVQLYRTLLEHGEKASVLSLPSSGFVIAAVHGAPDDLLRQLNVTARYRDKPPIMFRLAFTPAPEEPEPAEAPPPAVAVAAPSPAPGPGATAAAAGTAIPPNPVSAIPSAQPTKSAPVIASIPEPKPGPAPVAAPVTPAPVPVPVKPGADLVAKTTPAPSAKPQDNLGLHNLDREEAKMTPPAPLLPPKREVKSALLPTPPLNGSAEAPPPGSLLAMVWKPSVLEALPENEQEQKNYDVVDYARLGTLVGRYVQVITEGGKKIGGYILEVDENGVKLRVDREGGNITFVVAKARVQQVRLPHY